MLEWTLPLLTGLLSAGHCIGMCGGIVTAYSMGSAATGTGTRILPHLLYNGGRLISYSVLGALFGGLGQQATTGIHWGDIHWDGVAHLLFGLILLAYGLSALGVHRLQRLTQLEPPAWLLTRLGKLVQNTATARPLLLGLGSGLLPCSLLIAMQVEAMASGSLLTGMTTLALFAIGTSLPLLSLGLLTTHLTPTSRYRLLQAAGLLILVMAGQEFWKSGQIWLALDTPPMPHCH
ncbi:MAG: sulfite exporter TauE/SafE family protein [Magnetococcales bacterium]|nr:sulfite exporter TauE/SafE family protein [Magnetococcales bacterium]